MTTAIRTRPRAQVGRGTRRALLVAHIVASGAWIGIDVVLGVLVFTALSADPATVALCLQVLPLLFWPVRIAGLVSLVTGIALGLDTRYGLLRYWWVAVKLVINLVLVVLVALVLRGGLDAAAARGATGAPDAVEGLDTLVFPPAVSIILLVTATVLAVVKPWGRIRRSA